MLHFFTSTLRKVVHIQHHSFMAQTISHLSIAHAHLVLNNKTTAVMQI